MSLQEERSMISTTSEIYEQKSLFVYESVELELSLASLPQINSNNDPPEEDEYTCPIHLEQGKIAYRFFKHKTGEEIAIFNQSVKFDFFKEYQDIFS